MSRKVKRSYRAKLEVLPWRVLRHDGVLLGGYSHEAHARRAAWIICREGLTPGVAYVVERVVRECES